MVYDKTKAMSDLTDKYNAAVVKELMRDNIIFTHNSVSVDFFYFRSLVRNFCVTRKKFMVNHQNTERENS